MLLRPSTDWLSWDKDDDQKINAKLIILCNPTLYYTDARAQTSYAVVQILRR